MSFKIYGSRSSKNVSKTRKEVNTHLFVISYFYGMKESVFLIKIFVCVCVTMTEENKTKHFKKQQKYNQQIQGKNESSLTHLFYQVHPGKKNCKNLHLLNGRNY